MYIHVCVCVYAGMYRHSCIHICIYTYTYKKQMGRQRRMRGQDMDSGGREEESKSRQEGGKVKEGAKRLTKEEGEPQEEWEPQIFQPSR